VDLLERSYLLALKQKTPRNSNIEEPS
jgi:hypothetical protein